MIRRFLARQELADVLMLAPAAGGLVWLAAVHVVGMNHGPALMLAVLAAVGVFARWVHIRPTPPPDRSDSRSAEGRAPHDKEVKQP
jgi:ABC-type transport system involved in cytochrome bd biosynthesis fused ATPase/permease subunit